MTPFRAWALGDAAVIDLHGRRRWGHLAARPRGLHRVWQVELPDGSRLDVPEVLLERPEPS